MRGWLCGYAIPNSSSISRAYFCETTFRFSLSVGVNSPEAMENCARSTRKRLMVS